MSIWDVLKASRLLVGFRHITQLDIEPLLLISIVPNISLTLIQWETYLQNSIETFLYFGIHLIVILQRKNEEM